MTKRIVALVGTARQVFKELELAARYRGSVTIGQLAEPDILRQEKRAEAWLDFQDWRNESRRGDE